MYSVKTQLLQKKGWFEGQLVVHIPIYRYILEGGDLVFWKEFWQYASRTRTTYLRFVLRRIYPKKIKYVHEDLVVRVLIA